MSYQEVGNYVLLQTLGVGSTGKVKLVEHKITHFQYAMKIIKKQIFASKPDLEVKIQREIALMRLLDHPHLLKIVEVNESPRHLYIILEYAAHGELLDYLISHHSLNVQQAMHFFHQLIFGLDYLHSHSICHRDLKPENLLLDANDNVKIADFGFARWMKSNIAETSCGSPHYAAPEIVKGIAYDGRVADIWSCGVILYALLSGCLPFDDTSIRALVAKVKSGQYRMPDFPDPIKNLISKMLNVDPLKRISIEGIKHHPAFKADFPLNYVIPGPLPLPDVHLPIFLDQLDQNVVEILHQIGFTNDEELKSDLSSSHNNMPKAFARILMQSDLTYDSLPWPTNESTSHLEKVGNADHTKNNANFEKSARIENNEHDVYDVNNEDEIIEDDNECLHNFERTSSDLMFTLNSDELNSFTIQYVDQLIEQRFTKKNSQSVDDHSGSVYSYAEAASWAPNLGNHMNFFDGIYNDKFFLSSFTDNDSSSDDDPENNSNRIHYGKFKKRYSRNDDNNGDPHKESNSSTEKKEMKAQKERNIIKDVFYSLKGITFSLEEVFAEIQDILNKMNYDWFYPNEYVIICRKKSRELTIYIESFLDKEKNIDITAHLAKGCTSQFNEFVGILAQAMNNLSLSD